MTDADEVILAGIETATLDSELVALNAQLLEADEELATLANEADLASYEEIQKVEAEIERVRQAAQEQINALRIKIQDQKDLAFDARRRLKRQQEARDNLQRQIEQAERAKLAQQKFELLQEKWNKLIAGAPWREWAMPHQMEAAQKIANAAGLLLADTMGLGKTLSAFMACDMIEVMTNEASPEHPVEIGL